MLAYSRVSRNRKPMRPLAAAVAVMALAGCGGTGSGVVATEDGGGVEQGLGIADAPADAEQRVVTVDTEPSTTAPGLQTETGDAAQGAAVDPLSGDVSPESLSTGPVLQWSELELELPDGFFVHSTSDGRVAVIGGSFTGDAFSTALHLLVSEDGAEWTSVPLPEDVFPTSVDMSERRMALGGWRNAEPSAGNIAGGQGVMASVSDDGGSTWTHTRFQAEAVAQYLSDDATAEFVLASVYVSGDYVVVAAQGFVRLDAESLLVDAGLVPADARISGWESVGDSVRVWLDEGNGAETELRYSFDDLALTESQKTLLRDVPGDARTFLFGGNGAELGAVAAFDGWVSSGRGTEDGFHLILSTDEGDSVLTSSDGESWSVRSLERFSTPDFFHFDAFSPDGTIWTARVAPTRDDAAGSSIHRWRVDEPVAQTADIPVFEAVRGLAAGTAGLVMGGLRGLESAAAGNDDFWSDGSVTKEGYELRIGEPEGGMTLWDLSADEAVYVFGPEDVQGSETPPGVRFEGSGDSGSLTFEDLESGADLVTFTLQELLPVLDLSSAAELGLPAVWVGWSGDGVQWGWELAQDAFGLEDGVATVRFAVGRDFVVAVVAAIPAPAFPDGASVVERIPALHSFIARTP